MKEILELKPRHVVPEEIETAASEDLQGSVVAIRRHVKALAEDLDGDR